MSLCCPVSSVVRKILNGRDHDPNHRRCQIVLPSSATHSPPNVEVTEGRRLMIPDLFSGTNLVYKPAGINR